MEPHAARPLTPRQRQVLDLLADGLRQRDVATVLGIDPVLVRKHLSRAYARLGLTGQPRASEQAIRLVRQNRRRPSPAVANATPAAGLPSTTAPLADPVIPARPCEQCGAPVTKRPDTLYQRRHVFCDRACYDAWRTRQPKHQPAPRPREPDPGSPLDRVPPPPETYAGSSRLTLREQLRQRRQAERRARGLLDDATYLALLGQGE